MEVVAAVEQIIMDRASKYISSGTDLLAQQESDRPIVNSRALFCPYCHNLKFLSLQS